MSGDRALAELSELFDSGSEAIPSEEDEPAEGMEASAGAAPGAADRPKETRSRTKLKVSLSELVPEEILAQDQKAFEQEAPKDEFYELANELGAALDGLQIPDETLFEPEAKSPEEMSFEEVFQEFKKGVEKKVSEEDFATHYNLGIAYKEMELLDEAVGEFQLAARSPQYFVECCSMLGICFRQKGMPELAEKWYRKGIEAPGFPDEIYLGLKYDLADTLAEMGKADEAGAMFKEIYAQNAHYRDIKKRLRAYQ
jgi:tetratricopeptide (TPR) repeat protein